jgi:hypothetical protein
MMPRALSSIYGNYKRNLKIRRSGHLLRLGIWSENYESEIADATTYIIKFADRSIRALEEVNRIAKRQAMRSLVVRVIFNITDAGHIRQTREMINTAVSRFKVILT